MLARYKLTGKLVRVVGKSSTLTCTVEDLHGTLTNVPLVELYDFHHMHTTQPESPETNEIAPTTQIIEGDER